MDYAGQTAIRSKQIYALKGRIMTPEGIKSGAIAIENGKIKDFRAEGFSNMHTIDMGNAYIVPGFIDLHTHGVHEYLIDNGLRDLQQICRIIPQYGTTSFLPTVAPKREGED